MRPSRGDDGAVSLPPSAQPRTQPHEWRIAEREYARHEQRRGRRHAYEVLDPTRTALVVVDLVEFFGAEVAARYSHAHDRQWRDLDVAPEDPVLEKSSWGAFFPGSSELHRLLTSRGIDTILVTGTVTNVCVESTVREANVLGYRVVVVADGCAAVNDEMHNASLTAIYRTFGDVRSSEEVVALLGS